MATLKDYYNTNDDNSSAFYGANLWLAQTFTTTSAYSVASVKLKLYKLGNPGTITVSIKETSGGLPTGADLCSGTTDGNTLTTSSAGEWRTITFGSAYNLVSGIQYAIVIRALSASIPNIVYWRRDGSSPTYSGGAICSYNGSIWSGPYTTSDYMFETYTDFAPPADIVTIKKLVVAAANKIYYEDI